LINQEGPTDGKNNIMIIENDFNRQMQVIEQSNANSLDKTKSSKIAKQID